MSFVARLSKKETAFVTMLFFAKVLIKLLSLVWHNVGRKTDSDFPVPVPPNIIWLSFGLLVPSPPSSMTFFARITLSILSSSVYYVCFNAVADTESYGFIGIQ